MPSHPPGHSPHRLAARHSSVLPSPDANPPSPDAHVSEGSRSWDPGLRVCQLQTIILGGFMVQGSRFSVQCAGCRVRGLGCSSGVLRTVQGFKPAWSATVCANMPSSWSATVCANIRICSARLPMSTKPSRSCDRSSRFLAIPCAPSDCLVRNPHCAPQHLQLEGEEPPCGGAASPRGASWCAAAASQEQAQIQQGVALCAGVEGELSWRGRATGQRRSLKNPKNRKSRP